MDTQEKPEAPDRGFSIPPDTNLDRVSIEEFRARSQEILRDAKSGRQVALVDESGTISAIVGRNCVRVLPEPDLGEDDEGEAAQHARPDLVNPWVE